MLVVAIIDQGIQAGSRLYIHTATPAAISAIWSTERRKFFAAEVNGAIAAVTGFYIDFCMIVEHRCCFFFLFAFLLRFLGYALSASRLALLVFAVQICYHV